MTITVDGMIDSFEHPVLDKIVGQPTYESLSQLLKTINANAASVPCPLGNGQLGWLAIVLSAAMYANLSAAPFVIPNDPGTGPTIEPFATAQAIAIATAKFKEDKRLWNEYITIDRALKQQILKAVEDKYTISLRHHMTGYANVRIRAIISHLLRTYGRILPSELQENDQRFRMAYNPNEPIELLYEQLEQAMALADAANQPYSEAQILNNAYKLIVDTRDYRDPCRDWRKVPEQEKTWARFKTFFAEAARDLREEQGTSGTGGYHANNAYQDAQLNTAEAIANLASATASDRQAHSDMIATNKMLLDQIISKDNQITALTQQLATCQQSLSSCQRNPSQRSSTRKRYNNSNYCWSHGYDVSRDHRSDNCTRMDNGHKKDATRSNNLGGSQANKERT
jgi:hypothetical protein